MSDLLTLCQDVASDVGLSIPQAIVANGDETATRLLAQAKKAESHLPGSRKAAGWR